MKFTHELSDAAKSTGSASSIEMNESVYKAHRDGKRPIILSYGEAPFPFNDFGLSKIDLEKGAHYSDSRGVPELRHAIIKNLYSNINADLNPDTQILITAGSKLACYMFFKTILHPGDTVVLHEPAWVSYQEHARLCGAKTFFIGLKDDFFASLTKHKRNNNLKCLVLNNPNNPRGHLYDRGFIETTLAWCAENGVYLLVDESYSEYVLDQEFISCAQYIENFPNVAVVNSLSKNLGLSGWRIGYALADIALIDAMLALNRHLITCAPTVLQIYCAQYFEEILKHTKPQIKELQIKRQAVQDCLDSKNIKYLSGAATFYFFLDFTEKIPDTKSFVTKLLLEKEVAIVPGRSYGSSTEGFLRMSFAAETMDRINIGLERLLDQLK